jgi:hypothetical protein
MRCMMAACVLRLCIARYQACLQLDLMIVIVRYSGVDLGQGQLRILLDNVRYTLVRGYVIRDQVNAPMTSPVKARHPTRMHGNGWIDRGLTHNTLA